MDVLPGFGALSNTPKIFPPPTGVIEDIKRDAFLPASCQEPGNTGRFCWLGQETIPRLFYGSGNLTVGYTPSPQPMKSLLDAQSRNVDYVVSWIPELPIRRCLNGIWSRMNHSRGFVTVYRSQGEPGGNLANLRCLEDSQISPKPFEEYERSTVFDSALDISRASASASEEPIINVSDSSVKPCNMSNGGLGFCQTEDGLAFINKYLALEMSNDKLPFLRRPLLRFDVKRALAKGIEACFKTIGQLSAKYLRSSVRRFNAWWDIFRFTKNFKLDAQCLDRFPKLFETALGKNECTGNGRVKDPEIVCDQRACTMSYRTPGSSDSGGLSSTWDCSELEKSEREQNVTVSKSENQTVTESGLSSADLETITPKKLTAPLDKMEALDACIEDMTRTLKAAPTQSTTVTPTLTEAMVPTDGSNLTAPLTEETVATQGRNFTETSTMESASRSLGTSSLIESTVTQEALINPLCLLSSICGREKFEETNEAAHNLRGIRSHELNWGQNGNESTSAVDSEYLFERPGLIAEAIEGRDEAGTKTRWIKRISTTVKNAVDSINKCAVPRFRGCMQKFFNLLAPEWIVTRFRGDFTADMNCVQKSFDALSGQPASDNTTNPFTAEPTLLSEAVEPTLPAEGPSSVNATLSPKSRPVGKIPSLNDIFRYLAVAYSCIGTGLSMMFIWNWWRGTQCRR